MKGRALAARRAILTVFPALFVLAILWPLARPIEGSGDAFQFWYAGHLVVSGRSPYDQAAWHEAASRYGAIAANVERNCGDADSSVCTWAYPPAAAWLFAPFGALDPDLGIPLLIAFVIVSAVVGVGATALVFGPRAMPSRAAFLAIAFAGHPFVVDLRASHPVGVLLLGLTALASGFAGSSTPRVSAGAFILALKPHVLLIVAAAGIVLLVMARAWRLLIAVIAAISLTQLAAWSAAPVDLSGLVARAGAKGAVAWATTWALAASTGAPWLAAAAILALAGLAFAAAVVRAGGRSRILAIIAGAAAFSLVIAPYAQPYDYLLALPALAAAMRERPKAGFVCAAVYVAGTWGAILLGQVDEATERTYALLPVAALLLLASAPRGHPRIA